MAGTTTKAAVTTTERKRMTTICLSKYFDGSCEATIAANSLQLLPFVACLPVLLTTKLAYCSLRSSFTVEKPWKAFFCLLCLCFFIFFPSWFRLSIISILKSSYCRFSILETSIFKGQSHPSLFISFQIK